MKKCLMNFYIVQKKHIKAMLKEKISLNGGFLGPMISDVRDYYIDNFRFLTL